MKVATLCVLVVALVRVSEGKLPPPQASYKILMLLPVSSKSQRAVFMPLAEALAERGHKIMMLTNQHQTASKHSNIYEFQHGLSEFNTDNINMFDNRSAHLGRFPLFVYVLPIIARKLFKVPKVKELYEKRKEFDLIIIEHSFNEVAYPFLHEMTFIMIGSSGASLYQSAIQGNVLNPSYVPNLKSAYPNPMSLWQRFQNTVAHIALSFYWRNWGVVPLIEKEISAQFPELPPLLEIERNLSLALLNSHFSISMTLPLLPSEVEVGAMHCRPGQPLPEDLESWIAGAGPEGVIYFSLGSIALGTWMPVEYRDAFLEAFRRLPHRVIWKYEGKLEGVSDNVIIRKWLPQQDILAHDKVKVFITHGGLLSLQESIYHAKPLLSIPIFGDHLKNALFVKSSGLGEMLVWEDMTVEDIVNTLTDITTNPKYKENVLKLSIQLRDQLTTPQERAVFWTEYVIRHRGAPHLKSPAVQLSWVEFFMLDVLAILLAAVAIFAYILSRVIRAILAKVFGGGGKKKKLE